jgi:hypothetical protein
LIIIARNALITSMQSRKLFDHQHMNRIAAST